MGRPFRPFGVDHCVALLVIAALAALGSVAAASRLPHVARSVRATTAALTSTALVALMVLDARDGVPWTSYAPLQLCDLAVPIAALALTTRNALAFELTLTWSAAATLPALLTPELVEGFPHGRFLLYFAQHGGLIVATAVLLGMGLRPRAGTPRRALAWLNVTALAVGGVDARTGANFMYLRRTPSTSSPLDWFGPWPRYLIACEVIAFAIFTIACRPWRAAADRDVA